MRKDETMYQVIIADDERAIRTGLKIVVDWNQLGFEVAGCAQNGNQALEMILCQRVDVLLADIRMPGLDGIELVQKMRELQLPTVTILMSGYRDFEYARQAVSLGVREYLLKPVDEQALQELLMHVHRELEESAQTEAHEEELLIARIQRIMAENYAQNISLKSIAQQLNYNPAYLGRLFRCRTGSNFRDELNLYRVRRAAELLKTSPLCIYEIAERVGYQDTNYFYRVFHDIYGVSPGEYKAGRRAAKE